MRCDHQEGRGCCAHALVTPTCVGQDVCCPSLAASTVCCRLRLNCMYCKSVCLLSGYHMDFFFYVSFSLAGCVVAWALQSSNVFQVIAWRTGSQGVKPHAGPRNDEGWTLVDSSRQSLEYSSMTTSANGFALLRQSRHDSRSRRGFWTA